MNKKLALFPLLAIILLIIAYALMTRSYKPEHDIAITDIAVSKVDLTQGENLDVTITTKNTGSNKEAFNATCYAGQTKIGTQEVTDLDPDAEEKLVFSINTTTLPIANYEISAEISVVSGETNTKDNAYTDGIVRIRLKSTGLETLQVNPLTSVGDVGQTFAIDVDVSDVADLYAWELRLGWDAAVLEMVDASEGSFLKSGGTTFFTFVTNETAGFLKADCSLLGDVPGATGNGTLATFQFSVIGSGSCILNLYDTILLNSFEKATSHTVFSGSFEGN